MEFLIDTSSWKELIYQLSDSSHFNEIALVQYMCMRAAGFDSLRISLRVFAYLHAQVWLLSRNIAKETIF